MKEEGVASNLPKSNGQIAYINNRVGPERFTRALKQVFLLRWSMRVKKLNQNYDFMVLPGKALMSRIRNFCPFQNISFLA